MYPTTSAVHPVSVLILHLYSINRDSNNSDEAIISIILLELIIVHPSIQSGKDDAATAVQQQQRMPVPLCPAM